MVGCLPPMSVPAPMPIYLMLIFPVPIYPVLICPVLSYLVPMFPVPIYPVLLTWPQKENTLAEFFQISLN
jgi:hypothetical protein